jgi:hypothetical protein
MAYTVKDFLIRVGRSTYLGGRDAKEYAYVRNNSEFGLSINIGIRGVVLHQHRVFSLLLVCFLSFIVWL